MGRGFFPYTNMIIRLSATLLAFCSAYTVMAATVPPPCDACHSNHPDVNVRNLKDCLDCHDEIKKPLGYNLHTLHTRKATCNSCHILQNDKLFVIKNAKELGVLSESDWELYAELFENLSDQQNAAKLHFEKGLQCRDCHDADTPTEMSIIKNDKCESCHGKADDIAVKTAPTNKEQNPHKSHQGQLNCNKCHSGHGKAKSYCLECHTNFQQIMPEEKKQ